MIEPPRKTGAPAARVFGLTGGIGSGKSTVAALWRAQGLAVVEADQLAREAVVPGSRGLAAISDHFGRDVLTARGELDRKKLAALVFRDAAQREHLNRIVHPRVHELAAERFADLARQGHALIAYEIPLLFELGRQDELRPVVLVAAPESCVLARVSARDQLDADSIRARMAAQMPLAQKRELADIVVENAGDLATLSERSADALAQVRAWRSC